MKNILHFEILSLNFNCENVDKLPFEQFNKYEKLYKINQENREQIFVLLDLKLI